MTPSLIDAAIVIGATLVTTLVLLLISGQLHDTTAGNLIARSAPPSPSSGAAQPSPEQSLLGPPTPSPQPSRFAASPSPTPSAAESETATAVIDDSTIQAAIDRKFQESGDFSSYGLTVTISGGTVTVVGTVPSEEVKEKIEKLLRNVKGVKRVENQIVVIS